MASPVKNFLETVRKGQLGQAVRRALNSVNIREPWLYTGHKTNPDYVHYMPSGLEYRKISPGSCPVKAIVPHDSPSLVYKITYHPRDYRRNNSYTMRTVDAAPFDFSKMFGCAPLKPEQLKEVPTPPMMPTRGY